MNNTTKTIDAANLGLATLEAITKSLPIRSGVKAGRAIDPLAPAIQDGTSNTRR